MKELTKQEIESQKALKKDLDSRLAAFKKEMLTKTKEAQQKERVIKIKLRRKFIELRMDKEKEGYIPKRDPEYIQYEEELRNA